MWSETNTSHNLWMVIKSNLCFPFWVKDEKLVTFGICYDSTNKSTSYMSYLFFSEYIEPLEKLGPESQTSMYTHSQKFWVGKATTIYGGAPTKCPVICDRFAHMIEAQMGGGGKRGRDMTLLCPSLAMGQQVWSMSI